jgi:hypothetical protein
LPEKSVQLEIEQISTSIRNLSGYIEALWKKVWSESEVTPQIKEELEALRQVETLESWINTLPSPLSTPLWEYHAVSDVEKKIEHLFFFFEALTQLFAITLLSFLSSDTVFFQENCRQWQSNDPAHARAFLKTTMGNWTFLGRKLAKFIRDTIQSDNGQQEIQKSFGSPSPRLIDALSDSILWRTLEGVLAKRNEWKGHSGAISEEEQRSRLNSLESYLSRVRQIISDNLKSMIFIVRKEELTYSSGIHEYRVRVLQGPIMPFSERIIKTSLPMESNQIYLFHHGQTKPIKLLPLVKLLKGTQTDRESIYFYNRIENSKCRFISYQTTSESELFFDISEVQEALVVLMPDYGFEDN